MTQLVRTARCMTQMVRTSGVALTMVLMTGVVLAEALLAGPLVAQANGYREEAVRFESGGIELTGVVRLPEGPLQAGVVFLPGGGRQYLTLEPTWFAEQLAGRGIASIVFNKRGTETSGGDWETAHMNDFVADAGRAIETLRSHLDEDARIGVMGFSQGGRLAPVVAVHNDVDAVVSVSGPQVSVGDGRLYVLEVSLRDAGMPQERIDRALALWQAHFDELQAGGLTPELDARIDAALTEFHPSALPPRSNAYRPTPIYNSLDFQGAALLTELRAPWLAIFGEDDRIVPTAASVRVIREAALASGRTDWSVIVVPNSGHGINDASGERHPLYPGPVMDWLVAQLNRDR